MKIIMRVSPLFLAAAVILSGCAGDKPDPMATPEEQDLALQGLDIPMDEITEGLAFSEPRPEDALILKDVHFDFDKSDIRPEDKDILNGIAQWMSNHPDAFLQIEGHCDERGTNEYNVALGERRALSVRSYLTALGTNPNRLLTVSYGEEKPLCTESNESCWARNRRAHFLVDYGEETAGMEEPLPPEDIEVEIEEEAVVEEEVATPMVEEVEIEEVEVEEEEIIVETPAAPEESEPEEASRPRTRSIGRYHY